MNSQLSSSQLSPFHKHMFSGLSEGERSEALARSFLQWVADEKHMISFFSLRKLYYKEWSQALMLIDSSKIDNQFTRDAYFYILGRHYSRQGRFSNSADALQQIHANESQFFATADVGREVIRNHILAGNCSPVRLTSCWSNILPCFDNYISFSSYSLQGLIFERFMNISLQSNDGSSVKLSSHRVADYPLSDVQLILDEIRYKIAEFNSDEKPDHYFSMLKHCLSDAKRVAVVGKSPRLVNSDQGATLDQYDYVIRLNHIPKRSQYKGLGSKTSILATGPKFDNRHSLAREVNAKLIELSPLRGLKPHINSYGILNREIPQLIANSLSYRRLTSGLLALITIGVLLDIPIDAFGFDFYWGTDDDCKNDCAYQPGPRDAAGLSHEIDYERFFVFRVLPALCNITFYSPSAIDLIPLLPPTSNT